jgi:hypothetical protein
MNSNQLASFIRQKKEIFRSPTKSPIPDSVLDNLLSEAEVELGEKISQHYNNQVLGGIRLGYRIEHPERKSQIYWVGFGQSPYYEALLKFAELPADQEVDSRDLISISIANDGFIDELTNNFTDHMEKIINAQISDESIHVWMFAHTVGYLKPLSSLLKLRLFAFTFSPDSSLLLVLTHTANYGCCPQHKRKKVLNGRSLQCKGSTCV